MGHKHVLNSTAIRLRTETTCMAAVISIRFILGSLDHNSNANRLFDTNKLRNGLSKIEREQKHYLYYHQT